MDGANKMGGWRRWAWSGALLAGGLVAGAVLAGTMTANAVTPTPSPTSSSSTQESPDSGRPGGECGDRGRGPGPGGPRDESKSQRSDEKLLTGDAASKVRAAALAKYPGATIQRVETDSDGVYEAHLTTKDGARVTVELDKDFKVTGTESAPR
jgi:hypothetical protein